MIRTFAIFILFSCSQIGFAQTFQDLKGLIGLSQQEAFEKIESFGFERSDSIFEDQCRVQSFVNQESTIHYEYCTDEEDTWVRLNLMNSDLEQMLNFLSAARRDTSLIAENNTIAANSAFIFIEEEVRELFFTFIHDVEVYLFEMANYSIFEARKEDFETGLNFNPKQNVLFLFRELLFLENEHGESVEDILSEYPIDQTFNVRQVDEATSFLMEFRKSAKYEKFQKIVDDEILADKEYMKKATEILFGIQFWSARNQVDSQHNENVVFKIGIENDRFKSLIMLNYICGKNENQQ